MGFLRKKFNEMPVVDVTKIVKQAFLKNKKVTPEIINRVVSLTCKSYKITKDEIIHGRGNNGLYQKARTTLLCILYFKYKVSERNASAIIQRSRIACRVASKYFKSINIEKFEDDKIFMQKYEAILSKLNNDSKEK